MQISIKLLMSEQTTVEELVRTVLAREFLDIDGVEC
jgi:hypothetical protein